MKLDKSAVLASAAALTSSLACAAQPNVVFILADDMGYGDVSALNEKSRIRTPAIDALCRDGVTFTDAHSGSSVSTPSRYGILTGRYAFRTTLKSGVTNSYSPPLIAPSRRTIATFLSELGYSTACIGKWHLGWNWTMRDGKVDFSGPVGDGPVTRGFDYFFGIPASLDMPPYVYIENDRVTAQPTDLGRRQGTAVAAQRPAGSRFRTRGVSPAHHTEVARIHCGAEREEALLPLHAADGPAYADPALGGVPRQVGTLALRRFRDDGRRRGRADRGPPEGARALRKHGRRFRPPTTAVSTAPE